MLFQFGQYCEIFLSTVYEETNDPLCGALFREAGVVVARHLLGIAASIHEVDLCLSRNLLIQTFTNVNIIQLSLIKWTKMDLQKSFCLTST